MNIQEMKNNKCDNLLAVRNRVISLKDIFSEEEIEYIGDIVLDYCEIEGYITWDDERQFYVRNSDGKPISDI